jgi:Peptidase family M23
MKRYVVLLPVLVVILVGAAPASAWTWPVDGPVLQPFLLGDDPYAADQHRGVDIAAPTGAPVRAPAAGTVTFAGAVPRAGRTVTIETADGLAVTLVHLGSLGVARGAAVLEGDVVAAVGQSGETEHARPYVHLGIRQAVDPNGYLDPLSFLPRGGDAPASPPTADSQSAEPSAAQGANQQAPAATGAELPAASPSAGGQSDHPAPSHEAGEPEPYSEGDQPKPSAGVDAPADSALPVSAPSPPAVVSPPSPTAVAGASASAPSGATDSGADAEGLQQVPGASTGSGAASASAHQEHPARSHRPVRPRPSGPTYDGRVRTPAEGVRRTAVTATARTAPDARPQSAQPRGWDRTEAHPEPPGHPALVLDGAPSEPTEHDRGGSLQVWLPAVVGLVAIAVLALWRRPCPDPGAEPSPGQLPAGHGTSAPRAREHARLDVLDDLARAA